MKTYIGVHSDFVQKEYVSLSHAEAAGCIYVLGDKNDGNRPLLDLEGNRVPFIEAGGWKAHEPVETIRSSASYKTHIRFEDPCGEVQHISFAKPMPLSLLLSKLRDVSSLNSWNEYELNRRVQELESENRRLEDELEMLKERLQESSNDESELRS